MSSTKKIIIFNNASKISYNNEENEKINQSRQLQQQLQQLHFKSYTHTISVSLFLNGTFHSSATVMTIVPNGSNTTTSPFVSICNGYLSLLNTYSPNGIRGTTTRSDASILGQHEERNSGSRGSLTRYTAWIGALFYFSIYDEVGAGNVIISRR